MQLFRNEFIKLYKSKKILVLLLVSLATFLVLVLGQKLDEIESINETKMTQLEIYEVNKENLNHLILENNYTEKQLKRTLEKNETFYKENIPYAGYETGAYLLFEETTTGLFLSFILPFSIFLIAIEAIIGERNQRSLNFMLISPVGRTRILFSKFLTITVTLILTAVVYISINYIFFGMKFGFDGWKDPIVIMVNSAKTMEIWKAFPIAVINLLILILYYVSLGIFFSVIFKNYSTAFISFLGIFLLRGFSGLYLEKVPFSQYLPFLNNSISPFLFSNPQTEMHGVTFNIALISTLLMILILNIVTLYTFKKRDIY